MAKNKLFVGFRNGKASTMVFTTVSNYEDAVDCDYFVLAEAGTEKQQLAEWFSQQENKYLTEKCTTKNKDAITKTRNCLKDLFENSQQEKKDSP